MRVATSPPRFWAASTALVLAGLTLGGATCARGLDGGDDEATAISRRVTNLEKLAVRNREQLDKDLAAMRDRVAGLEADLEAAREDVRGARGAADERSEGLERRIERLERLTERPAAATPPAAKPAAAAPQGPETWTTAEQGLAEARAKFEAKDFAGARDLYAATIERFPNAEELPEATYGIGESHFQQGDYAQAVIYFDRLTKNHPKSPRVAASLLRVADCFEKLGQPEDAKLFYQHVLAEFPNSPEAAAAKAKLSR